MLSLKVASLLVAATPGFQYIPKWHLVELPAGTAACFTFEQSQELAMLDIDLQTFAKLKVELPKLHEAHAAQVKALEGNAEAEKRKALELEAQRDALNKALRVSETARIKAENNPTAAAGWLVAAGVGLIAVGLGIGLGVATSPAGSSSPGK